MKKENILKALNQAKKESQKRNFRQSFDLIINLKGIDNKKVEHQIDDFVELHYSKGKPTKVCALVGPELYENAKNYRGCVPRRGAHQRTSSATFRAFVPLKMSFAKFF